MVGIGSGQRARVGCCGEGQAVTLIMTLAVTVTGGAISAHTVSPTIWVSALLPNDEAGTTEEGADFVTRVQEEL